jgi:hypothetical protein
MSLSYTQETTLHALAARAAIEELNARHGRAYEDGDVDGWIQTFTHSGSSFQRGSDEPATGRAMRTAFETWKGRVHLTFDPIISVDGVNATQQCRFLIVAPKAEGEFAVEATGRYDDDLVYERGAWYVQSRRVSVD